MYAVVLAAATALGGCAVAPANQTSTATASPHSYHAAIKITGRLSAQYQTSDAPQSVSGGFSWDQQPDHTDIDLVSPLGQTIAQIRITPLLAQLTRPGSPPQVAADADQLTLQALGWPLPINGLADWLQGRGTAQGGKPFTASTDTSANPSELVTSNGWTISYDSWSDSTAAGPASPRRISLKRWTSQAGEVRVRLVIDSWQPQ